jgi:serine/threonine-protein kinase HipA
MTKALEIFLHGYHAATVEEKGAQLRLSYRREYLDSQRAVALSRSIPLSSKSPRPALVLNWLNNLLPDNLAVRDRWAREFQVSANSPFALLQHVGRDCAGAVTFVDPEVGPGPNELRRLSSGDLQKRLDTIARDGAAWDAGVSTGQFSLAGAQAKFALRKHKNSWFEASGDEPTSHIIKPSMPGFPFQNVNEYLSMTVAARVGLVTAQTQAVMWKEHPVLIVERFDRAEIDGKLQRLHQEDLCQALGISPDKKYQVNGGPSARVLVHSMKNLVRADEYDSMRNEFARRLAFNWLIGGTDAHAKNYSWFVGQTSTFLTPMYDLNSILVYLEPSRYPVPSQSWEQSQLAMSVGKQRRLREISTADWTHLAQDFGVDPRGLISEISELAEQVIDEAPKAEVGAQLYDGTADFAHAWAQSVVRHAKRCAQALTR